MSMRQGFNRSCVLDAFFEFFFFLRYIFILGNYVDIIFCHLLKKSKETKGNWGGERGFYSARKWELTTMTGKNLINKGHFAGTQKMDEDDKFERALKTLDSTTTKIKAKTCRANIPNKFFSDLENLRTLLDIDSSSPEMTPKRTIYLQRASCRRSFHGSKGLQKLRGNLLPKKTTNEK